MLFLGFVCGAIERRLVLRVAFAQFHQRRTKRCAVSFSDA
jgi:hypothetical protein